MNYLKTFEKPEDIYEELISFFGPNNMITLSLEAYVNHMVLIQKSITTAESNDIKGYINNIGSGGAGTNLIGGVGDHFIPVTHDDFNKNTTNPYTHNYAIGKFNQNIETKYSSAKDLFSSYTSYVKYMLWVLNNIDKSFNEYNGYELSIGNAKCSIRFPNLIGFSISIDIIEHAIEYSVNISVPEEAEHSISYANMDRWKEA